MFEAHDGLTTAQAMVPTMTRFSFKRLDFWVGCDESVRVANRRKIEEEGKHASVFDVTGRAHALLPSRRSDNADSS